MGNTFANKKFVGEVIRAEEDGKLITQYGDFPFKVGDRIFRPFDGDAEILNEHQFKENYIPVERVTKKKVKVNLDEMARNYKQDWVNNEDAEYINKTYEIASGKDFNNN